MGHGHLERLCPLDLESPLCVLTGTYRNEWMKWSGRPPPHPFSCPVVTARWRWHLSPGCTREQDSTGWLGIRFQTPLFHFSSQHVGLRTDTNTGREKVAEAEGKIKSWWTAQRARGERQSVGKDRAQETGCSWAHSPMGWPGQRLTWVYLQLPQGRGHQTHRHRKYPSMRKMRKR